MFPLLPLFLHLCDEYVCIPSREFGVRTRMCVYKYIEGLHTAWAEEKEEAVGGHFAHVCT